VYIDHGIDTSDMVALTFHLSGTPQTVTALLDLLAVRSVAVTAFAVGTWITAHPEITRRVVADGHELGNHTEHHLTMRSFDAAKQSCRSSGRSVGGFDRRPRLCPIR
jgi:peptidoglycan/xylan/chitin deacetylase (PgdA/CDA1 family)